MAQISGYVATGGTGALTPPPSYSAPPPPPFQFTETAEMLALKQRKILTILSVAIAPVIFAIIGGGMLNLEEIAAIPFMLVPIGIAWAVFRYRTQLRQLQESQVQQYYAQHQLQYTAQQASGPQFNSQFIQPQAAQPQAVQSQLNAPRTNPLDQPARGSIVEDETRKFPEQRR